MTLIKNFTFYGTPTDPPQLFQPTHTQPSSPESNLTGCSQTNHNSNHPPPSISDTPQLPVDVLVPVVVHGAVSHVLVSMVSHVGGAHSGGD
jgi:hypothetical protein